MNGEDRNVAEALPPQVLRTAPIKDTESCRNDFTAYSFCQRVIESKKS